MCVNCNDAQVARAQAKTSTRGRLLSSQNSGLYAPATLLILRVACATRRLLRSERVGTIAVKRLATIHYKFIQFSSVLQQP